MYVALQDNHLLLALSSGMHGPTMTFARRRFFTLAAGAACLPVLSHSASAQAYPARSVRIVVGYAAGGSGDIVARLMGQWLSERLKQPFIIENKVGAGGNIAIDTVLRSPPDGYTLVMITTPTLVSAPLPENFDLARDTIPIAGVYQAYLVMLIHPSVPVATLPEFIAYAKANPGKLSMASAGNGTAPHMSGELFKMMAGVDIIHVPYRGGGPALSDLLGGQVQVMFSNLPANDYIKTGKLRALAVTTATRSPTLPEIPTLGDFVPGYEASVSFGLCAPKGTPPEIVEKLNTEINAGLADSKIRARFGDLGARVLALSPADFGKFLTQEALKWDKVARAANIKPG
jgi:tripartite-type tricarboxylate transporter receptor subunit TctC